jgi:hypothetical protein
MNPRARCRAADKPATPKEALAWWNTIVEHLRKQLEEYKAHKPLVSDARYGHWLSDVRRPSPVAMKFSLATARLVGLGDCRTWGSGRPLAQSGYQPKTALQPSEGRSFDYYSDLD